MKILFILLFSLPLFSFEGNKLYQCVSKYRIVNGAPHEFSPEEQNKSLFQIVFNKKLSRVKTSDGKIYDSAKTKLKGQLYIYQAKVNGRLLKFKLQTASNNGLYRSVSVTGYGDLVNEFVLCQQLKTKKNTSKKSE